MEPAMFLHPKDYATTLTPDQRKPTRLWTNDEIALWHLANRTLLVDTEAGIVCRADGRKRAETPLPNAYGTVYLGRVEGKIRWARAHRVVWLAAHGPIPGMYVINHRNSRRWDNRIGNLDMTTRGGNTCHAHNLPYEHVAGRPFLGLDDRPDITGIATGSVVHTVSRARRRAATH